MDLLIVYLNDVLVGRLTDDGKAMSFAYDRAYAAGGGMSANGLTGSRRTGASAVFIRRTSASFCMSIRSASTSRWGGRELPRRCP